MEKETLTRFERLCIQEEPPLCTAACPFHVDVKAFVCGMADRDLDKAFKVLEKHLPIPEILARICDHPCEDACIRQGIDAAIAVGDLERVCAGGRSRQKKYFPAPQKDFTVAVWGSGPSSLAAAWDLSLKGFRVSLFFPGSRPGGPLRRLSPAVLPEPVLDMEIGRLKGFGAVFHPHTAFDHFLEASKDFQALFFGADGDEPPQVPEDLDPFTLREGESNRFFGGFSGPVPDPASGPCPGATRTASPVWFAFQGRKAATSIDRMLSRVSMAAGRDREGPFETRLDTDETRIVPAARIAFLRQSDSENPGADPALAAREAARCHQCDCSRCIRACNTYIESFGGFPGKYAREIYNNLAIVMGERKANRLINSCTFCELCKTVCPHEFSMADLCRSARQEMVERDLMPPSAHEFALAEMAHAREEASAFAVHAPGQTASSLLFYPGCQLTGSAPGQAARAWEWLRQAVDPATGMVAGCCGAPAFWAGRQSLFEKALAEFSALWTSWGEPEIVTACTSCSRMLERAVPKEKLVPLYEKMAARPPLPAGTSKSMGTVAVSDPCTAREDRKVQAAVRALAAHAGLTIEELAASGALTECCGFGGLTFNANPDLGKEIITARAAQSPRAYLAYCAMCRDRLARTGKKAVHLLDLFWPEAGCQDPRPDPGFSLRRMNRIRFKTEMAGEATPAGPAEEPDRTPGSPDQIAPKILISDEMRRHMENQFILVQDIEAVFASFSPESPTGFAHAGRGSRILSRRSGNVTFWVEFLDEAGGFRVTDTWCHRMTIAPSSAPVAGKPSEDHDADIRCNGCGRGLVFFKNHVEYLGSRFDVDLPQCPDCGAVYISPRLSRTKMAEVEQILEDK